MQEDISEVLSKEEIIEEESPAKKFLRKAYILMIAFFLIAIILSSSLAGSHVIFLFSGKIASVEIKNSTLSLGSKTIYFEPAISDMLSKLYRDNQQTEIKLCLTGKKVGDNYFVTGMYTPIIYKKDVFSVTSQICDRKTIIDLHTHPYLHCIFSNQDMSSYDAYRRYNPDAIMALMCDERRFSLYGY